MRVLVTGGAGFIGSHLVDRLLADGHQVTVVDNFDDFYSPTDKLANLASHRDNPAFRLKLGDIRSASDLNELEGPFDAIAHLAARAGVRPSIDDPLVYQDVNIRGTLSLLEFARDRRIPQFVFASSSSVYGVSPALPWSESERVPLPISPYAATKLSGELLGHVYSELYGIRFIALRLFTVFGPRQRPDLAIRKFAQSILAGRSLTLFGDGGSRRDYTYVADIIQGVTAALSYDASTYEIINLGNSRSISLGEMVAALEAELGVAANVEWGPDQPGDVPRTWADIEKARSLLGYEPATDFALGLRHFADWLRGQDA